MFPFLETGPILLGISTARLAVAFLVAVYQAQRKTCPGFYFWLAGASVGGASGLIPALTLAPEPTTLLVSSQLQVLASVLVLDGALRYVRGRGLDSRWYAVPAAGMALSGFPGWSAGHLVLVDRGWVATDAILRLAIAACWLQPGPASTLVLRRAAASVQLGWAGLLAVWVLLHGHLELYRLHEQLHTWSAMTGGVLEMFGLTLFVMLDGRRVEDELQASRTTLESTVRELQECLAQVEILTGILPVCSACRRIRDEDRWTPLEEFVLRYTDGSFSSAPCPRCQESPT